MMNPSINVLTRLVVVAPPVLLSYWLGTVGYPVLPRAFVCLALGGGLIVLVAHFQRRRSF